MSLSYGSNAGVKTVLLILAYTGKEILAFLGSSLPASILVATSNCIIFSFALSFTRCSMVPKPTEWVFADTDKVPKSANTMSTLPSADHPPCSSMSDNLSSLAHTSALRTGPSVIYLFSTPIKIPRTSPRFGFPCTEIILLPNASLYIFVTDNPLLFLRCFKSINDRSDKSRLLSAGHILSSCPFGYLPGLVTFNGILIS